MKDKKINIPQKEISRIKKLSEEPLNDIQLSIYNFKDGKTKTISSSELIKNNFNSKDICVVPELEIGKNITIPPPVDIKYFKKIKLKTDLPWRKTPNIEIFIKNMTLTVTYENQTIFEEPEYNRYEYFDSEGVRTISENKENYRLFERRTGRITEVLKKEYGKSIKVVNRCVFSPERLINMYDVAYYIQENRLILNSNNTWGAARFAMNTHQASLFDNFLKHISGKFDFDKLINKLGELYIENCGISAGMRTAFWDTMVYVYEEFNNQQGYSIIIDSMEQVLDSINPIHKDYDIIPLEPLETILLLVEYYYDQKSDREFLAFI